MASTTQETHTANTPQPYGGSELGAKDRSTSKVDTGENPASPTRDAAAVAGGAPKSNVANGHNESRDQSTGNQGGRKDTNGVVEPAEEEGGAARGTTEAAEGENAPSKGSGAEPEGGYPEQLHAGKLDGPGPEYGKIHKVTLSDRIQGVKEEIKGSIKRDPELRKTGKERMTGELKRKQLEGDQNMDPVNTAEDEKKDDDQSDAKKTRTEKTDEPGLTEHPQAHPTEKGREDQAATVHPEST